MEISEIKELAVLSTEVTNIKTAVNEVKGDVKEVKTLMNSYSANFVSRTEWQQFKKQYWLSHSLTALLTALTVALVGYFINNN